MPPDEMEQPTDKEGRMLMKWLEKVKYLSPKDPGPFVIRRLTKTEYGNTLHDLFGEDPRIADGLPDEVGGKGYLNSMSPLQLEQYLSIADEVLDQVLVPPDPFSRPTSKSSFDKALARIQSARIAIVCKRTAANIHNIHLECERSQQEPQWRPDHEVHHDWDVQERAPSEHG